MAEGLSLTLRQRAPIALDCTLECAAGELVALVGPSGSGKTTVLRCVAGLDQAGEGRITCGGALWFDRGVAVPPQQRRVGMVFQAYSLLPHLSAEDNVALALWHLPRREQRQVARQWLSRVHLQGLEERRPAKLSGGQQQRVALARALARAMSAGDQAPGVLLLDEPFAALDQVTRRKLQQELARLRRELPVPIVLVTHDLDEARMLADRMVLLHHGTSLQQGAPEDILSRPADVRIARLVGHTNLFEAEVVQSDGAGASLLWQGQRLTVSEKPRFRPGTRVCWLIPPEGVLLLRRDWTPRDSDHNLVSGCVEDSVALGPYTQVGLRLESGGLPLSFSLPTRVARRYDITAGAAIRVSLLAESIHLMPWSDLSAQLSLS